MVLRLETRDESSSSEVWSPEGDTLFQVEGTALIKILGMNSIQSNWVLLKTFDSSNNKNKLLLIRYYPYLKVTAENNISGSFARVWDTTIKTNNEGIKPQTIGSLI